MNLIIHALALVWVLVDGSSTHVSGPTRALEHARTFATGGGRLLYAERDGQPWVIRDAMVIARARDLEAPMDELGRKQGELGRKQGELGRKQGELGQRMGELARRAGDDEKAEEAMEELAQQQEALGQQQEALGDRQEALGEKQERLADELEKKLAALVDEAIAAGRAQKVK